MKEGGWTDLFPCYATHTHWPIPLFEWLCYGRVVDGGRQTCVTCIKAVKSGAAVCTQDPLLTDLSARIETNPAQLRIPHPAWNPR
jgi:hypothetical protein